MSGPDGARRAHYRDFYAGLGVKTDDRPVLVVHGNCQAESLRLLLDGDDVRTVRVPPVHELTAADVEPLRRLLARTDLLVSQPVARGYRGLPLGTDDLLDLAGPRPPRTVLVPGVRYAGLHPAHLVVHPPGLEAPDPPVVAYHDVRTAVRAAWLRAGLTPAGDPERARFTAQQVLAVAADSRAELARREAAHGTVVASDLLAHPTDDTVRTVNHPGNAVLVPLAARVRAALGLGRRRPGVTRPLLDAVRAPVEIEVAAAHGPGVTARRDWSVDGRVVDPADVAAAHRGFYARRPDVLDAVLGRAGWLLELLGLELPPAGPSRPAVRRAAEPPVHVVPSAPGHGVALYATQVADAVGARVVDVETARGLDRQRVHVHVTDRLFGATCEAAAVVLADLGRRHPMTVTLHDVPQPGDGAAFARRALAYRRVLDAATGWAVSSAHERALVTEHVRPARPGAVVHLPVVGGARPAARPAPGRVVGLLGWVYPGKGHLEVLRAAARLGFGTTVRALGAPAAGHEGLVDELAGLADELGVGWEVSGWVPDVDLAAALAAVDVPVAAHRNVSASGSINSWVAAGRRPLVARGSYTSELAALRPGTLTLVDDDPTSLAAALEGALADPDSTWLPPGLSTRPHLDDVAAGYRRWWGGLR